MRRRVVPSTSSVWADRAVALVEVEVMLEIGIERKSGTPLTHTWVLTGQTEEKATPRSISLAPFPFRVGRRSNQELTLPRNTISGHHAEFFEQDRRLYVRDLQSTNGTFVNGQRLTGEQELRESDLVQFADLPFRLSCIRSETPSSTRCKDSCDQALAIVQFGSLISGRGIVPNYQPIVDLASRDFIAFEVLARSRLIGLESPDFMFTAASQLGSTVELSRVMRKVSVEDSCLFGHAPHLFLNTHPKEVGTEELLAACGQLRKISTHQPMTIEIHEAALTDVSAMKTLRNGLEAMNMSLAFDDFGAGQARIAELSEVCPHYVKFDRSLIRAIDQADSMRRRVIKGLVAMVSDIGSVALAEGVETADEARVCADLGFALGQGYYFGKPMPAASYLQHERANCEPANPSDSHLIGEE